MVYVPFWFQNNNNSLLFLAHLSGGQVSLYSSVRTFLCLFHLIFSFFPPLDGFVLSILLLSVPLARLREVLSWIETDNLIWCNFGLLGSRGQRSGSVTIQRPLVVEVLGLEPTTLCSPRGATSPPYHLHTTNYNGPWQEYLPFLFLHVFPFISLSSSLFPPSLLLCNLVRYE